MSGNRRRLFFFLAGALQSGHSQNESTVRFLTLSLKIFLFLLLLGFAAKNSETVSVRYPMGLEWQAPLSLVLLITFALGMLLGLLGCSRHLFKNRREIRRLRGAAGQTDSAKPS